MASSTFSAVLLAGGQSTRMGRDKALLKIPGSGLPLWRRQWNVLEELRPEEIFWSGAIRPNLPDDIRVVPDALAAAGPLGGIDACLGVLRSDLLVVLAVDLPQMSAVFLRDLLARCSSGCGVVARQGEFFEPLAAVYPRAIKTLSTDHLSHGRHAMQDLVREGIKRGMLRDFPLEEKDAILFKNWNRPEDVGP